MFLLSIAAALIPCLLLRDALLTEVTWPRFLLTAAGTAVIPNGLFWIFFHRRQEWRQLLNMGKDLLRP